MNKRPNIIIFNPDQMRYDALSHSGNPAANTPYLDQMVESEAISFRNAFCQNPVCVPSRCSFLTGLYPHVNGHRTMNHLLRSHETSLLKELKEAGYYVWMNARNDMVAGQVPGLFESHASEVYYAGNAKKSPGPEKNLRDNPDSKDYYSFYNGKLKLDKNGKNYTYDDEDIDAAIDRIRNPVDDRPICIFLGLNYPHPPYKIEEPYFSAINNIEDWPRAKQQKDGGKPLMEELIRENQQMSEYTSQDWNTLRSCYLGMCSRVDDMFQYFCESLKEAGAYDDSAIFFFSDHGDYTGDYNLTEKTQNTFEDCLTKVPLIIKPHKGISSDAGIADGMVELVDFYATALDFANVESTHSHYGISLRSTVNDRTQKIREYAFCEGGRLENERHCDEYHADGDNGTSPGNLYYPRMLAQTNPVAHGKGTMIRSLKYKYIRRMYEPDEFYDLERDPLEELNMIDNPEYKEAIIKLQMDMLDWYQSTCDVVPYDYDDRFTFDIIWNRVKRACPPAYEEKVQQMIRDGANMFQLVHYCEQLQKEG